MPNLFADITILDFTRVFSGPLATLSFAEWGAKVIKIEPPQGDDTRRYPPLIDEWSGYFEMLNHNKDSRVIDLKTENGKQQIYDLVSTADVVVENFSPGVTTQLGIDYTTLSRFNSRLIYASLVGMDASSDRKYYDVIAQAESGLMSLTGQAGAPTKIGPAVVDAFAGMNLAFAIASALYYREKTEVGRSITVSMLASAMRLLEQNLTETSLTQANPAQCGNQDTAIAPFGVFATGDGHVVIAAGNDLLWERLEQWLALHSPVSRESFVTNQLRLQNQAALTGTIESVTRNYSTQQVLDELSARGIPCGHVRSMLQVIKDPWLQQHALRTIQPKAGLSCIIPGSSISFSQLQSVRYQPAPTLAATHDTTQILHPTARN